MVSSCRATPLVRLSHGIRRRKKEKEREGGEKEKEVWASEQLTWPEPRRLDADLAHLFSSSRFGREKGEGEKGEGRKVDTHRWASWPRLRSDVHSPPISPREKKEGEERGKSDAAGAGRLLSLPRRREWGRGGKGTGKGGSQSISLSKSKEKERKEKERKGGGSRRGHWSRMKQYHRQSPVLYLQLYVGKEGERRKKKKEKKRPGRYLCGIDGAD